ncbi:uncharacterized protein [Euwallacea fornicatus]|uniref:uncharacterized protein n=1 Tax=Euwallacea fornicatus TaxID=995702 RepID=UPI00338D7F5A
MEKTERKADQFVHTLLTEGAEITCDDSSEAFKDQDHIPSFYDEKLFKRGQSFYHANSFAVYGCKIFGLMSILFIPTILRILVHTKKSGNEFAAYKRYAATILHMMVWYESDFKPGSRLWRSITEVKNLHNSASKSGCKVGLKRISQKDMALTQFGFMGYQLIRGHFIGMRNITDEDWKGFIHLWRVVGHLLGIEDRFNICRESVRETREICEKLIHKVFIPKMNQMDQESLLMIKLLINGLWVIQPMLNFNTLMYILQMVAMNDKNYKINELKALSLWEKCNLYILFFIFYCIRWTPFRWYFNYTHKRDLWLIKNFPFLVYYKFGFKNSRVQILNKTE